MDNTQSMKQTKPRRKISTNLGLGLLFITIGILLFARQMGAGLPQWLFRWEMIVIAVGLAIGLKSRFRDFGWIPVIGVGLFFLADDIFPELDASRYFFPVAFLIVGVVILFNLFGRKSRSDKDEQPLQTNESGFIRMPDPIDVPIANPATGYTGAFIEEERLDVAAVFSGVNKKIFSKNFAGGEVVCVFGGSEVDLMNADIMGGPIELEVVSIFGGATLFLPSNWYVKSELVSIFGGVDDKRKNPIPDPNKVIIIKGVFIFGGLEIKTRLR
ncbi:MAG: hypothetical protein EOO04_00865 [Chitinophagaceae bacterium]|nr:MAG: hypothetical protein EOO04_00865 [Chitinophagaceae bacterium]